MNDTILFQPRHVNRRPSQLCHKILHNDQVLIITPHSSPPVGDSDEIQLSPESGAVDGGRRAVYARQCSGLSTLTP